MLALAGLIKWTAAAAGLIGLAAAALTGLDHQLPPELPLHAVMLRPGEVLLVMPREVTRREWRACAEAGACEDLTGPIAYSSPDMPMTGINRFDVEAYLSWVNARGGGHAYRLPTADEWQAIAAALPKKPFKKLFDDPRLAWAANYGAMETITGVIRPSGGFGALPNGISDLGGNVWEWTATCARDSFDPARCPAYKVEGLHETALSVFVREPFNGGCAAGTPPNHIGFRLVAEE